MPASMSSNIGVSEFRWTPLGFNRYTLRAGTCDSSLLFTLSFCMSPQSQEVSKGFRGSLE
eukprot:15444175-Alexandrium_andersonii.AAC.1